MKGHSGEAKTRRAFEKLLTDQHIADAIQQYDEAAYVNALVAMVQGLQRTDGMQEQRLSMQARHAVNLYITSNRDLDYLNPPALEELPVWTAAAEFVKAVKDQPTLSFEDHALFPLWVLLLGDGPNLRLHYVTMAATHVVKAHERFIASFVQKFVFDKQLGANSWENDCSDAVDFWSIYLSHLLTICGSEGYIDEAFRGQYREGLLTWQIRVPGETDGDEEGHLLDGQQPTRKKRAAVQTENQSGSDDEVGCRR